MPIGSRSSVLLFIAGSMMSAASIDTITPWNGTQHESPFGAPAGTMTSTYGQTISVPSGTGNLLNFTFEITCTAATLVRGEVYAWDGTKATGPNLFEGALTIPASTPTVYLAITFNTGSGGIPLPAGNYVLFASTSKDLTGAAPSTCFWGTTPTATYPAGVFVYENNGANVGQWTTLAWSMSAPENTAFQANFVSVPGTPAPRSLTLVCLGLIGLGLLTRSFAMSRSSP